MMYTTPTLELLAHATDVSALRQSVYAANIANAQVEGYQRLEVTFDREVERFALAVASSPGRSQPGWLGPETTSVVRTDEAVQLDQEMAAMAQNALRYQTLIGAFERTIATMRLAIREGRE